MVKNLPGDVQRRHPVGRTGPASATQGKLVDVVHGRLTPDGSFATLIVLEFRFLPLRAGHRFRTATIKLRFQGPDADPAGGGPEVHCIAPDGTMTARPTGGQPPQGPPSQNLTGSSTGDGGWTMAAALERQGGVTIRGAMVTEGRPWGPRNVASWILVEDPDLRTGIPAFFRSAILLGRKSNEQFSATIEIEVKASTALKGLSVRNLLGGTPKDNPIIFDPNLKSTNARFDPDNLASYDLNTLIQSRDLVSTTLDSAHDAQVSGLKVNQTPEQNLPEPAPLLAPQTAAAYSSLAEIAEEAQDGPTGQMLLDLSSTGTGGARYAFKRFDTLGLLNLYSHQHDLVLLDKKIFEAKGNVSGEDRAALAKLLREYRLAIQNFQEMSQLNTPLQETAESTAQFLGEKLKEPWYTSARDAYGMIDLTPDEANMPSENSVQPDIIRITLQEFLTHEDKLDSTGRLRPTRIKPFVDQLSRILISFIGGAFLLVPMVALSFICEARYRLLTVVLFVLLFAVAVATLANNASLENVLAATAAYAAVLVVFIGQAPLVAQC